MTLRTTLAALLVTLVSLSGCTGGVITKAPDAAVFTPADEARLAELQARLNVASADPGAGLPPADSTLSRRSDALDR